MLKKLTDLFRKNHKKVDIEEIKHRLKAGKIYKFNGGVEIESGKHLTSNLPIKEFPELDHYFVPLLQHRGVVGELIIEVGQQVLIGQPLTKLVLGNDLSVHSPVNGKIIAIIDHSKSPTGQDTPCVVIESNKEQTEIPYYDNLELATATPTQIYRRIQNCGIAGLGGAVFPSHLKISIHSHEYISLIEPDQTKNGSGVKAHTLLINSIECEPYITCDDLLAQNHCKEIISGAQFLMKMLDLEQTVIAFESNMPQAITQVSNYIEQQAIDNIYVRKLPTIYPQGSGNILFQTLTGIKPHGLLNNYGVYSYNLATVFSIARACQGYPLYKRLVTITGEATQKPGNYWIKFGTPIEQIQQYVNATHAERILMGGPMMGFPVVNLKAGTLKSGNCFIFTAPGELVPQKQIENCIRCSTCQDYCPRDLQPQIIYWYSKEQNVSELNKLTINDCIECALCDFVCPSQIPLVSYIKQGKNLIYEHHHKEMQQRIAKKRVDFRNERLEAEVKLAKEKAQLAAEERRKNKINSDGVDPVQAALARLNAKERASNESLTQAKSLQDNALIMAERKAKRLAREQEKAKLITTCLTNNITLATIIDTKQSINTSLPSARERAIAKAKAMQAAKIAEKQKSDLNDEKDTNHSLLSNNKIEQDSTTNQDTTAIPKIQQLHNQSNQN